MTSIGGFVDAVAGAFDEGTRSAVSAELEYLTSDEMLVMNHRLEWLQKARPAQLPPEEYFVWLLLAGRGTGKTRSGAEDVFWTASQSEQRIAIVGPTLADVRKTCFEGESGLESIIPKSLVEAYNRSLCEMWLTNGSYFVGYSSEEPERLRGPQHHRAWCDELASWRYLQATWDMLMFGLRLGERPDLIVTTTPKPVGLIRQLIKDPGTKLSSESTYANAANLPVSYIAELRKKYEGTRLGEQELHAKILDDNPFAFWTQKILDDGRVKEKPTDLERIVVALDPPKTTGESADEAGIVVAGRKVPETDARGWDHLYVLDDRSVQGLSPEGWAGKAVSAYYAWQADAIVAEVNQGGDMVESIIHTIDSNIPVVKVTATRGKVVRAEPIAALYEQGRGHHYGSFPQLEDQMCDFTSDFDKEAMGYSPDRVDALVWAATDLMIDGTQNYSMLGAV